jgi:hypothetical protein
MGFDSVRFAGICLGTVSSDSSAYSVDLLVDGHNIVHPVDVLSGRLCLHQRKVYLLMLFNA